MNWEAPSPAVGDVTFYVASVAANGNGLNGAGDNVYLERLTIDEALPNAAPIVTAPGGTVQVTSEAGFPITGISVFDADAGAEAMTLTLSAQDGTLLVSDSVPGGVGAGGISDNGSALVTMTATQAELNATLGNSGGLIYTSEKIFLGADTLRLGVNDNGHSGAGGAKSDNVSVLLFVNHPPVYTDLGFLGDGSFRFTFHGVAGQTYAIESSEGLESWTHKEQVTLAGTSAVITDTGAPAFTTRFYRARQTLP